MDCVTAALENSRLAAVIAQVEKGEAVDMARALALQALELVRVGQLVVVDAMKREDESDEKFRQLIHGPAR